MNSRDNMLRSARFEVPERIPLFFGFNGACWTSYSQDALEELILQHPLIFPNYTKKTGKFIPAFAPWRRAGIPYTDSWGCVWETTEDGITGAVIKHAIPVWESFSKYVPPSPAEHDGWGPINWADVHKAIVDARTKGELAAGSLRHGHTFLTLTYLRGYENFMFDMCDENPQLPALIAMVEEFNRGLVEGFLQAGVEWIAYPEDLGMQVGPMLSPEQFRRYIKPSYQRLVAPARKAGCVIHMHSDGDVRDLAQDLLEVGVDVINLQDLVNGISWLAANLKGRVCIDLDIDRQRITRFGTPEQIDDHIRQVVEKLGGRKGGLMLRYDMYPGLPLRNVKSLMDAMEKYSQHFS